MLLLLLLLLLLDLTLVRSAESLPLRCLAARGASLAGIRGGEGCLQEECGHACLGESGGDGGVAWEGREANDRLGSSSSKGANPKSNKVWLSVPPPPVFCNKHFSGHCCP